jgi:hypothetical protein
MNMLAVGSAYLWQGNSAWYFMLTDKMAAGYLNRAIKKVLPQSFPRRAVFRFATILAVIPIHFDRAINSQGWLLQGISDPEPATKLLYILSLPLESVTPLIGALYPLPYLDPSDAPNPAYLAPQPQPHLVTVAHQVTTHEASPQ